MIAMALSCSPELIIADEPTTALDVTIQAQIVELVKRLQAEFGTAVIWISHDLGVVARLADRVAVMYAGYHRRAGARGRALCPPGASLHRGLLNSLPRLDSQGEDEASRPSRACRPTLSAPLRGCPFVPRCAYATDAVSHRNNPALAEVAAEPCGRLLEPPAHTIGAAMSDETPCPASNQLKMHFPIRAGSFSTGPPAHQGRRRYHPSTSEGARPSGSSARAAAARRTAGRAILQLYRADGRAR